ncbi:hypothetical protein phiOC_p041 [Ochrobactrum phage vB_OspM_OC]|nr:hypothetical protein phiOC_p041 [Ochrobactrum phage vB_OspM_OC]
MEKFVFHITERQFNGLVKLAVLLPEQRGREIELKAGTHLEMWMTSKEVHDLMIAVDSFGPNQKVFDQGDIAELYLNICYAWQQYETSRGLD